MIRLWVVGGTRRLHGEAMSQPDALLQHEGGIVGGDGAERGQRVDVGGQRVAPAEVGGENVDQDAGGIEGLQLVVAVGVAEVRQEEGRVGEDHRGAVGGGEIEVGDAYRVATGSGQSQAVDGL